MAKKKARALRWKVYKTYYGWRGVLYLPYGTGTQMLKVTSPARKGKKGKAQAIKDAAGIASQIASNPLLQAALPPGTGIAVKAVGKLADAALKGKAGAVLKKLTGAGAKRLAKSLKFW